MLNRFKLALLLLCLFLLARNAHAASNLLAWVDNSSNEVTFVIERKTEPCSGSALAFLQIATVPANIATYTDSAVVEGLTYCYRVAAQNATGNSAYSNFAARTVPFSAPSAPSGLTVQGGP